MDIDTLFAALPGMLTGAAALYVALVRRREAKTQDDATALGGYQAFCDDLMQRMTSLEAAIHAKDLEIARLRERLDQLEQERVEWHYERVQMQQRIKALEDERADLKAQLAKLEACR